jgi:hypothetical protein
MNRTNFLEIAGLLHVGLIWAGATMPRAVHLRGHLASVPPFIRRLFWVYHGFVGFVLISFGLITFWFADVLASGAAITRALCSVMALFWGLRLAVAAFVFDVRPYLTSRLYRVGYAAINVVFVYLAAVYTWMALAGPK